MRTQGTNQTIKLNNLTISYDDLGEGNTPIIFLHGYPFNKSMWQPQLQFLQTSNRVIAIDIRGFGASKDEETILSIGLFADDLIKFMNALHIDKAIICGQSMGGYIAQNAVHRFPGRFSGLILCDTKCSADTKEGKEKRYATIDEINANGVSAFNEAFINSIFYKGTFLNKKEIVDAVRTMVFSNSKHIITMGQRTLADRSETRSTLHDIHIPTLIICGREDMVTPLKQSEYMHSVIKGSILQIINHAGHVPNLEQSQEFNKHLSDFINNMREDRKEHSSNIERGSKPIAVWDL